MRTFTDSCAGPIFEEYLNQRGLRFEYEAVSGRKKPDYIIHGSSGDCIVEVKQIEDPSPMPNGGVKPYQPIRNKIKKTRCQFGEYKHLPCGLVIYSKSIRCPPLPINILSAAFGPGFQQINYVEGMIDPNPPRYRFFNKSELPRDKEFLANATLTPNSNTTFSVLAMITHYELHDLHLEIWRRAYEMQKRGEIVQTNDQFRLFNELESQMEWSIRYAGTIRVIVIKNNCARIPFPEDVFSGPFDQHWGWENDSWQSIWIGEKLKTLYDNGVPFCML